MARGRTSGLTVRGRSLLAGGIATAVCAVVLDERDLLRVAVVVALLPLLSLCVVAGTRRALRTRRTVTPARLPVGAPAEVTVALSGGPLFGALRVFDAVPDAAGPQPATPPRFTVYRLPAGRGVTLRYPLRPVLRGAHRVGPLVARIHDPLGLAEVAREFGDADRLLALPAIVDLHGLPVAPGRGEGTPGAAMSHQGAGEPDVMVRPYRSGDELRRVHWRATARHDELMVRLEERPWRGELTVLLDRRDQAHRGVGAGSSLEFAVSLAASICAHLDRHGEPVTLRTEDGAVLGGVRPAGAAVTGSAVAGVEQLLDALTVLRPSAALDLSGPPLVTTGGLVAILGDVGGERLDGLLARHPGGGHAILLDVATWDPGAGSSTAAAGAAALRAAGWQVTVATAASDPRRCWAALAAAGGGGALAGTGGVSGARSGGVGPGRGGGLGSGSGGHSVHGGGVGAVGGAGSAEVAAARGGDTGAARGSDTGAARGSDTGAARRGDGALGGGPASGATTATGGLPRQRSRAAGAGPSVPR